MENNLYTQMMEGLKDMITITPWENGLHSLSQGLDAFNKLQKSETDKFALKDSILRNHHALETIFKAILLQINPVFILTDNTNMKTIMDSFKTYFEGERKNTFFFNNEQTIGLKESLMRLRHLKQLQFLTEQEYQQLLNSTQELIDIRNRIQHLGLTADVEVVSRILGNVVPRSTDIIQKLVPSFLDGLTQINNEAQSTIEFLRNHYDVLIQKAIEFFKKKTFEDLELRIRIKDHGKVGAPPYFPEVTIGGFISLELKPHMLRFSISEEDNIVTDYTGSVDLSNPIYDANEHGEYKLVHGSITYDSSISLLKDNDTFSFVNDKEVLAYLRNINIDLKANINYTASAFYNNSHYDVREIHSINGKFSLNLSSVAKGYSIDNQKPQLQAKYETDLNQINAPFTLHSFVLPDKRLSDHYSLDWTINTFSDLIFK